MRFHWHLQKRKVIMTLTRWRFPKLTLTHFRWHFHSLTVINLRSQTRILRRFQKHLQKQIRLRTLRPIHSRKVIDLPIRKH
jgi:hypothetical protein